MFGCALGGFFFPQQFIQLAWLWKLYNAKGTGKELQEMVSPELLYFALPSLRLLSISKLHVTQKVKRIRA